MKLEAWVKEAGKRQYTLLHVYDICATSGELGPKRKEGDLQVPEGVYHINHFNPQSNFYLSLGISYPNTSDKVLSDRRNPGGAIYIHGNCVTIGCLPITDEKIKELYVLAVEARNNGQLKIPIHIFPAALHQAAFTVLQMKMPAHRKFWENLKSIYDDFEDTRTIREIEIDNEGFYSVR